MPEAYEVLDGLRRMLTVRREEHKERMARGVDEESYVELRGRTKELATTIDTINQTIKSLNSGDDDDTQSSTRF